MLMLVLVSVCQPGKLHTSSSSSSSMTMQIKKMSILDHMVWAVYE